MILSSRDSSVGASWMLPPPTNIKPRTLRISKQLPSFPAGSLKCSCFPCSTTVWHQPTPEESFSCTTTQKSKHLPTYVLTHEVFPPTHSSCTFQTWCPISNQVLATTEKKKKRRRSMNQPLYLVWVGVTMTALEQMEGEKWKLNKWVPSTWYVQTPFPVE